MKRKLLTLSIILFGGLFSLIYFTNEEENQTKSIVPLKQRKKEKKSIEEQRYTVEQRHQYDYDMQKNPITGVIPKEEKALEFEMAMTMKEKNNISGSRNSSSTFVSRGPTNLGGRTRAFAIDLSDNTGNTMLAGGVSSGMFRSTNGGASWTKVSENDEIHNVTAIAQDPRPGFQNIWYYGTGELLGNSASLGSAFNFGQGIWQSTDNGLTWNQIPGTDSTFESFDTPFDIINSLAVSPTTGELFVAAFGTIYRYDGTNFNIELQDISGGSGATDVKVTSTGRIFASFAGNNANEGVYTSPNGNGNYTRIAQNGTPVDWSSVGRAVLGIAPSNTNIVYALYSNGNAGAIEADLWRYDLNTDTWTDFSSKLPDEPGGDLGGNDPFAIQGGYDLEVSVKPDDENFVVIGGTNVYRIEDINTDVEFARIGGYRDNTAFFLYDLGGGDVHHPDIQDLVFSPFNNDILFTGSDGGIHRSDVTSTVVGWTSLNNNYQTYQFYHVGIDPEINSNFILGGAQDNGTHISTVLAGNTAVSETNMTRLFGGDGVAVSVGRTGGDGGFLDFINDIQLYFGAQNGTFFTLRNNNFINIQPTPTTGVDDMGDPISNSIFITYFYLDTETNTMYYVDGDTVYRGNGPTVTAGTWTDIGELSTNENVRSMVATRGTYNPSSSYALIGGQNGGVFRHDDPLNTNLSTAINITPTGASTANFSVVSGVAIHPTNPDIAMVVYSNYGINNIYLTSNATDSNPTWDLVERNLSANSVRSVAITEVNGQIIYFVGTARGLYSNTDPLTTDWTIEAPNQIGFAVVSSLVYRPSDNILLVGTHGNGMFQTDLNTSTLSTSDVSFNNEVSLYPNPASDVVTLAASGSNQLKQVSIIDINGKLILEVELDSFNRSNELDISGLSSGVYFVRAINNEAVTIVKKLIVE